MWKASADRFTWCARGSNGYFFHWSYQVPFKYTWGFLWSWLLSNPEHSLFSWWKTCLYEAVFWKTPYIEYPANYLGNGIFLSKDYLCFPETLRMCKQILLRLFWFGRIYASFVEIAKSLSSTGLSPGQISHPCFKVCKCASFLANYLQALIIWPNQFTSPYLIFFFRQPNLCIWTFKEKEISCRQTHDMENFSSNSWSLAKLQAIVNSPIREVPDNPHIGLGFQLHLQPGQEGMDIVSAPCPVPASSLGGVRSSDLWCALWGDC